MARIDDSPGACDRDSSDSEPLDQLVRCEWVGNNPLSISYHDHEWGVPITDERLLFEYLCLETAQAGLSWITILKKRENYRSAFAEFNPHVVAKMGPSDVTRLLENPGIVRNKKKIEATIQNANLFLQVQAEWGSFYRYSLSFVHGRHVSNRWAKLGDVPPVTEESTAFAKDLKKRGFRFLGPTTVYAHMQACGLVNDHTKDCFRHAICRSMMEKMPASS
jgi:DNA-3-methyladenine glycosylase I